MKLEGGVNTMIHNGSYSHTTTGTWVIFFYANNDNIVIIRSTCMKKIMKQAPVVVPKVIF